ncbi:MAG: winged helix-turn-helix transcriptional regulator [Archangium sp.]
MLIIRELLLGTRRYSELLAALPGITTNLLADRLKELTEAGAALEPAIMELARSEEERHRRPGVAAAVAQAPLRGWARGHHRHLRREDVVHADLRTRLASRHQTAA